MDAAQDAVAKIRQGVNLAPLSLNIWELDSEHKCSNWKAPHSCALQAIGFAAGASRGSSRAF